MVRELAEFERAPDEVEATEELLTALLFGGDPAGSGTRPSATSSTWIRGPLRGLARRRAWLPSRCGSSTPRPGPDGTGSTSRTSTSGPSTAGAGSARLLLRTLAAVCVDRGYPGSSGGSWTGTRARGSTTRSAPRRSPSGSLPGQRRRAAPSGRSRRPGLTGGRPGRRSRGRGAPRRRGTVRAGVNAAADGTCPDRSHGYGP